ncbi:polyisoprenoid-binding protein YceI [Lewinella aquimaris]|uniref:Polyisoprenoid-binding protein YceI n=1 Tax=Neolewinella aquimaris TaxID=1835722 RepID=A0A840E7B5_9BACT|nr:YceI family protein [Neolewinella aquimaris]MBB4079127.1 polyisoprenoid-binding protein YceI [Neolewinella aquimaris]
MIRLLSLAVFSALLTACGPSGTEVESSDAVAENATAQATASYTVDPQASTVIWNGTKLIGGGHTGIVPIASGNLETDNGKLVGGEFTLDLAGLENTDLDGDGKGKLEGHLKSADFFDVEQHPTAKFTITGVTPAENAGDDHNYDITGNLTMKGNSRSITIPASVTMEEDRIVSTTPDFVIDRTEWGIVYNAGSTVGIVKDKVINDEIGLKLDLVAKR